MKFVVAMTAKPSTPSPVLVATVDSLLSGLVLPEQILVTLPKGVKTPSELRDRKKVKIIKNAKYGVLSVLLDVMEQYSINDDIYVALVDSTCTYPPHLLQEYTLTVDEIKRELDAKVPNNNGSIYGLGGVVMVKDKARALDLEFRQLIGKSTEAFEERNSVGYIRENATVDYLEASGSVLIHRSLLKDDFQNYLDKVLIKPSEGAEGTKSTEGAEALSADVLLSNYFAKHGTLRTQVCNLAINRFMLVRGGYLKNYMEPSETEKRELFERTIKHLRREKSFYAYQ